MKLVASVIARNELGRYLRPCIEHLLSFVDEIRVFDDGSTDGSYQYLRGLEPARVVTLLMSQSRFYEHEGRARQALLEWTLAAEPTHVLAIDADEFVADPAALRAALERDDGRAGAWNLCMQEVWAATSDGLDLRMDGGWAERDAPILWAPERARGALRMPDRALASGRTPSAVAALTRAHACSAVLHFGWTNRGERAARYQRYVEHDGGRFHARAHLDSIMSPDDEVSLLRRGWPDALAPWQTTLLERANR